MSRGSWKMMGLAFGLALLAVSALAYEKHGDALAGARGKMNQRQFPEALADADAAEALALNPAEKAAARMQRAQILGNSGKAEEAAAEYRAIANDPGFEPRHQAAAFRSLAGLMLKNPGWAKSGDMSAEVRALLEGAMTLPGLSPADLFNLRMDRVKTFDAAGDWKRSVSEMETILKEPALTDPQKEELLQGILGLHLRHSDLDTCRPFMAEIEKGVEANAMKGVAMLLPFAAKAADAYDFTAAEDCYRKSMARAPENMAATFGAAEMALLRGDGAAAQADLQKLVENVKVPAAQRYVARILQAAAASRDAAAFRQQIAQIDRAFAADAFTVEQRFKLLREASARLFTACRYEDVRSLEAETASMLRPEPKKTFVCRYVKDVPRSADAWSRSPLLKDDRYRESRFDVYANLNDELQSDLARLAGSTNAAPTPKKAGYDTAAYIVYDERGVHIYVDCKDPEARRVDQGLVSGGSLELYVQPGIDHAYHQWFFELPGTDDPHQVNWDTPHRRYRYTYDYLVKNAVVTEGGIGAYTFIPWLLVYDKLPTESNLWRFGMQRYSQGGSLTLGGAVHEIGRSLELTFEMPAEMRQAVKREIVIRAFARYQQERKRADGASLWSDPELGDPAFFKGSIEPLLESLDKAGESISGTLGAAEVNTLYETVVPDWMELPFKIAELRQAHLKARFFE